MTAVDDLVYFGMVVGIMYGLGFTSIAVHESIHQSIFKCYGCREIEVNVSMKLTGTAQCLDWGGDGYTSNPKMTELHAWTDIIGYTIMWLWLVLCGLSMIWLVRVLPLD